MRRKRTTDERATEAVAQNKRLCRQSLLRNRIEIIVLTTDPPVSRGLHRPPVFSSVSQSANYLPGGQYLLRRSGFLDAACPRLVDSRISYIHDASAHATSARIMIPIPECAYLLGARTAADYMALPVSSSMFPPASLEIFLYASTYQCPPSPAQCDPCPRPCPNFLSLAAHGRL